MKKYNIFLGEPVQFISSSEIQKGVVCDVYEFTNTGEKDLGIIYVKKGHKTPKQKILKGSKTIEGLITGQGYFSYNEQKYFCDNENIFELNIGDIMQWEAITDIEFYEICYPPYEDERFESL